MEQTNHILSPANPHKINKKAEFPIKSGTPPKLPVVGLEPSLNSL